MRRTGMPLAASALIVLLVFALGGCSSGGEDTSDTEVSAGTETTSAPSGATREEIIEDGNSICAEVYAAVAGLDASSSSASVRASQRADLYEGMVERLRGLESQDPDLTDVFASGRDLVTAAESASEAASEGDAVATASFEEDVEEALGDFQDEAGEFGLTDCAGEGSTLVEPIDGGDGAVDGTASPEPDAPVDGGAETAPAAPEAPDTGGVTEEGESPDGGAAAQPESGGGGSDGGSGGAGGGGGSGATGGYSPG